MADGNGSVGVSGASITAAATAMGSVEDRFHRQEIRQRRWGGCFGGFSCFGSQKGGKRIVPASRIADGNASSRANGPQTDGHANQNTVTNISLLAPPSSPASFTNSALASTAQSPACYLSVSANSPVGAQSTMFTTGPYAHETQLVSPPVFSTYTTEPSTAPFTPPPELAHLTTPSSPDVPYAKFLSSSDGLKGAGKANGMPYLSTSYSLGTDLQANYPLYPGSPSSSLISPASGTPRTGLSSPFPEREVSSKWGSVSARDSPYARSGSSKLFASESASPYPGFFYPATSAQFYLDQAQQPFSHGGGRLSFSREMDAYPNSGNKHNKPCKQDVEEIEAYRASFGFSADEINATHNYVEIPDALDVSFSVSPLANGKAYPEQCPIIEFAKGGQHLQTIQTKVQDTKTSKEESSGFIHGVNSDLDSNTGNIGSNASHQSEDISLTTTHREGAYLKVLDRQGSRRNRPGPSCSDAEIDYRRARSLREANGILSCRNLLP